MLEDAVGVALVASQDAVIIARTREPSHAGRTARTNAGLVVPQIVEQPIARAGARITAWAHVLADAARNAQDAITAGRGALLVAADALAGVEIAVGIRARQIARLLAQDARIAVVHVTESVRTPALEAALDAVDVVAHALENAARTALATAERIAPGIAALDALQVVTRDVQEHVQHARQRAAGRVLADATGRAQTRRR